MVPIAMRHLGLLVTACAVLSNLAACHDKPLPHKATPGEQFIIEGLRYEIHSDQSATWHVYAREGRGTLQATQLRDVKVNLRPDPHSPSSLQGLAPSGSFVAKTNTLTLDSLNLKTSEHGSLSTQRAVLEGAAQSLSAEGPSLYTNDGLAIRATAATVHQGGQRLLLKGPVSGVFRAATQPKPTLNPQ